MIHTPALAGSTMPNDSTGKLDYNNGKGYHSQCYFVQVFENEIVFNGLNVTDNLIYPAYSYIMEGSRTHITLKITKSGARSMHMHGQRMGLKQQQRMAHGREFRSAR